MKSCATRAQVDGGVQKQERFPSHVNQTSEFGDTVISNRDSFVASDF